MDGKPVVDSCPFPMLQTQQFAEPSPFSTWALTHCISHSPATKEQESAQDCGNQSFSLLPYIWMPIHTLYCLYPKYPAVFETEQQRTPLCWQCARMTRSMMKTAKFPANRWELARVQVLWDTVEGQGQVCAANCTADTAVLRICHWSPQSTASPSLHPNSSL